MGPIDAHLQPKKLQADQPPRGRHIDQKRKTPNPSMNVEQGQEGHGRKSEQKETSATTVKSAGNRRQHRQQPALGHMSSVEGQAGIRPTD